MGGVVVNVGHDDGLGVLGVDMFSEFQVSSAPKSWKDPGKREWEERRDLP